MYEECVLFYAFDWQRELQRQNALRYLVKLFIKVRPLREFGNPPATREFAKVFIDHRGANFEEFIASLSNLLRKRNQIAQRDRPGDDPYAIISVIRDYPSIVSVNV